LNFFDQISDIEESSNETTKAANAVAEKAQELSKVSGELSDSLDKYQIKK